MSLSSIATNLINDLGYWGLAGGLMIDSMGVPIPSEVLIPLAVVGTTGGHLALWAVLVVAVTAQMVGAVASFYVGRKWGTDFSIRIRSFEVLSRRHMSRAASVFARHGGWIAAGGRCLPVVRGFIGYPAGAAGMDLGRFVVWSVAGSLAWTSLLIALGELLSANLAAIDTAFNRAGLVIEILLGVAVIYGIWRARRRSRTARRAPPDD